MLKIKPILTFAIIVLAGCVSTTTNLRTTVATPPFTKSAPSSTPIQVSSLSQPVQLSRILMEGPRGESYGQENYGQNCIKVGPYSVFHTNKTDLTNEVFHEIFREELTGSGYRVAGSNHNPLFDTYHSSISDLLIGGIAKEIDINICYPRSGQSNFDYAKGGSFMKISWQVYSIFNKQIVYETETEGSVRLHEAKYKGAQILFYEPFRNALRNLLADQKFHDFLTEKIKKKNPPEKIEELVMNFKEPYDMNLENQINDINSGVVTVKTGGGHGSGFFINEKGYVLTNYHVVEESKSVKIIMPEGQEISGDVIRVNKARDIALIRVEEENVISIPISEKKIAPGGDVYAIGTPYDEKLNLTISKGVLSNYRTLGDLSFIQSDVNILPGNSGGPLLDKHGNVIGVAVSALSAGAVEVGLNFFIPIDAALEALGIKAENITN